MNSKFLRATVGALLLLMLTTVGCGYSDVSPRATEYAKAIYRITNLKKTEKIQPTREQIEKDVEADELSASEAKLLYDILDKAEAGKWESAMKNARSLMEAQVRYSGYESMRVAAADHSDDCRQN